MVKHGYESEIIWEYPEYLAFIPKKTLIGSS